jgi:hypothetical protein
MGIPLSLLWRILMLKFTLNKLHTIACGTQVDCSVAFLICFRLLPCTLKSMKRFFALIGLLGFALVAPSSTTLKSGVFFAAAGTDAKLRFEFKFGSELLFNRAGSSSLPSIILGATW